MGQVGSSRGIVIVDTVVEQRAQASTSALSESEPTRELSPDVTQSLRRRAVRGGTILLVTRLTIQVLTWAVTLLVVRFLRPYDYGVMAAGMICVGLADLLAEAGIGRALIHKEKLEPDDIAEGFTLSAIISAALYVLLFFLAEPAALLLKMAEVADFLQVLALLLLLVPFRSIALSLLDRNLALGRQSIVHATSAVVQAGLVLGLALAGLGYWALAAGAMTARLMETVALVYCAGWRPRLRWPGARARALLGFGIHISASGLLWFIYTNADQAIVGNLAGPIVLGYYALAFQLMSLPVEKLTTGVNQIAYPMFCRLQNDRERLRNWYLRLTALLGFLSMPLLAGLALVAEDAFALVLSERWLPAVLPFQMLTAVGACMVVSCTLPPLFNALGRPDVSMKYSLACSLLMPPCFFAAGLAWGLIGICTVWLVLYPTIVLVLVWRTRSFTGVDPAALLRVQMPAILSVVTMVWAVLLARWLFLESLAQPRRLGLSIAIGAVTYTLAILLVGRRSVLADCGIFWRHLRGTSAPAA
jgi:teichuronic acid exporter